MSAVAAKTLGLWLALLCASAQVRAQQGIATGTTGPALPVAPTGEDVYRAACATCHGADGRGSPTSVVGFDTPLPDFTDCAFSSGEPDPDWTAVVQEGGPVRGLDRHMPAFGDALSKRGIALAIGHLRTFCTDTAWPRGDLNLPRAFFTEKAFPENEAVWSTTFTGRMRSVTNALIYERRIGARSQIEVVAPIDLRRTTGGAWRGGLGDVAFAFKRSVYANVRSGGIGAAGLEVVLPTGSEPLGLGGGVALLEPFAMWGQVLPRNTFLQLHGGLELPTDSTWAGSEPYFRTSLGTTIARGGGVGRAWSPQVEVLWARPHGGPSEWDVVPQLQVTLSKLQHVMIAGGVRIPVSQREDRPTQGLVYLLWDWFDGGFFEFWK
jgi:mono/diheme cytochrome c family protein